MNRLSLSIASLTIIFLTIFSSNIIAEDNHADHVFSPDDVLIGDKIFYDGANTRITPVIDVPPPGVVIDEIYLIVEFKFGEEVNIERLLEVRCNACVSIAEGSGFSLTSDKFKHQTIDQDLIASYGFAEPLTRPLFTNPNNWTFLVSGQDPVISIQVYFTFHDPGHANMPDLYGSDDSFPGENKLLKLDPQSINMDTTVPFPGEAIVEAEKVVVFS